MKISELIAKLQEFKELEGDLKVHYYNDEFNTSYSIDEIELTSSYKHKLIEGVCWPNVEYESIFINKILVLK